MQKRAILVLLTLLVCSAVLQAESLVARHVAVPTSRDATTCNPGEADYWTGSTDGTDFTATSEVRGYNTEDGWFMFDISGLPEGVIINSVEFHGYVNSTNYPYWAMTPISNNPLEASADVMMADINAEVATGYYIYQEESSSFEAGWKVHDLGSQAAADVQASMENGWWACGMASTDDDTTYYLIWDGWSDDNSPYIVIDYSEPGGPTAPTYTSPADGSYDMPFTGVDLEWAWGDNNNYYSVYLDTVNPPVNCVVSYAQAEGETGSYNTGALIPGETYYWQVRGYDSEPVRSEAAGAVWAFAVIPATIDSDYLEDFNSLPAVMPEGWLFASNGMPWEVYEISPTDMCVCASYWNYNEGNSCSALTPPFDLSVIKALAFDWSHKMYNSDPDDGLEVYITVDGGNTWTLLASMFDPNLSSNDGAGDQAPGSFVTKVIDLTDFSGIGRIRFDAISGYGCDLFVDNVRLEAPRTPIPEEIYITEVSDNMPGQNEATGYIELINFSYDTALDLGGCYIVVGNEDGGVFTPVVPDVTYTIPDGTILMPFEYLLIGGGADEATFKTAWGITDEINYLPGSTLLGLTSGFAYQFDNDLLLRAPLDFTPNVAPGATETQTDVGMWSAGTPDAGTPGANSPGQTLPVELSSFSAMVTASNTVMLEWASQSEVNTQGYHVHRAESNDVTEAQCLTQNEIIEVQNVAGEAIYPFEDIDVGTGHTYYYWLETVDYDGTSEMFGPVSCTITTPGDDVPDVYATTVLGQNHPNPFNPTTTISYSIKGTEGVPVMAELAIYNVRGQRVKTLFSGMVNPGKNMSVIWQGRDDNGNAVASGVYFYKLTAPGYSQINKMMLLK